MKIFTPPGGFPPSVRDARSDTWRTRFKGGSLDGRTLEFTKPPPRDYRVPRVGGEDRYILQYPSFTYELVSDSLVEDLKRAQREDLPVTLQLVTGEEIECYILDFPLSDVVQYETDEGSRTVARDRISSVTLFTEDQDEQDDLTSWASFILPDSDDPFIRGKTRVSFRDSDSGEIARQLYDEFARANALDTKTMKSFFEKYVTGDKPKPPSYVLGGDLADLGPLPDPDRRSS